MAYFAEIDENNVVIRVLAVPDSEEHRGQDFLATDLSLGGTWLQTSYNSFGGVHYDPDTREPSGKPAFRKNYAGEGYTYSAEMDAFIPPKPLEFPSWVIDENTGWWIPPIPMPQETGIQYYWDEENQCWVENTFS